MKRFFIYLSVLASVAFGVSACVDQVFPKGTDPTPVVKASDIDITISDVKDSSFTATITPKAEGKYYSYLIVDSASMAGKKVDSMSVYKCSYDGLVVGCKESVKGASTTVKLEDLDPNSTYIVYAVNSSAEGNVSRLAQAKVKTSDTVAPFKTQWETDENVVTITFSEPVQWDKTKEISYGVWMKGYLAPGSSPASPKEVTDSVIVDGAEVTIVCTKAIKPGAAYNLNFPEGTFTDVVGNPCPALTSQFTKGFDFTAEDPDAEFDKCFPLEEGSICGVLENADLDTLITLPEMPEAILLKDFATQKFIIQVPTGVGRCDLAEGYETIYSRTTSGGSKVVEAVPMKKVTHYYGGWYDVTVKPAGTAQHNDVMTIVVPAGAIRDWWGNVNADDIELGPVTIIDPKLTFENVQIGCNNVIATATPNTDVYYYCGWCENVQDSLDADLIANAKAKIKYWADYDKITFAEEYETYFASQGTEKINATNLEAETEYRGLAYGFFMTSDGTVMSQVFRQANVTTGKLEMPTETTGTFTYKTAPYEGSDPGLPVSIDKDTIIIKGYGINQLDLKCVFDKSGNIRVQTTAVHTTISYGTLITMEYATYYQWRYGKPYGLTSYYNPLDKTIYFRIANVLTSGSYAGQMYDYNGGDTFCFDNSQPASGPSSVKSAVTNNVKLSKYIALPEKELRRHAPRR